MNMKDRYELRGVSSQKEDIHKAISSVDKGIFPNAFCKIIPDISGNDNSYCNIMHSDGAGTKSSLAYIYYKETGDISVFKGIAMDSIVMNIDDLICVGAIDNFLLSSTIGRNKRFIDGSIIETIIKANYEIAEWFSDNGITLIPTGGETADIGDIVRTIVVDTTLFTRVRRDEVIDNRNIKPDLVIIGLASSGKAKYEEEYNSGIGSNGLTSARHDVLNKIYKEKYPESYDTLIDDSLSYSGRYFLTDRVDILPLDIGKALLSPTRTYSFVLKEIFKEYRKIINGIIHCSGGGQTKSLKFGKNIHYIKDNLFDIPPIFKIIQKESNASYEEMFKTFNMGHRMEIYTEEKYANDIIEIIKSFNIEAKIIGYTEYSEKNRLTIKFLENVINY